MSFMYRPNRGVQYPTAYGLRTTLAVTGYRSVARGGVSEVLRGRRLPLRHRSVVGGSASSLPPLCMCGWMDGCMYAPRPHTYTHVGNRKNKSKSTRKAVGDNSSGTAGQPLTSFGLSHTHTQTHTHIPLACK